MTATIHARLIAAITARRDLASKSRGPDWELIHSLTGQGYLPQSVYAFIGANGPLQIERDTAAHLRIVERHAPKLPFSDALRGEVDLTGDPVCGRCDEEDWPCPDWLDVASSYPDVVGP